MDPGHLSPKNSNHLQYFDVRCSSTHSVHLLFLLPRDPVIRSEMMRLLYLDISKEIEVGE